MKKILTIITAITIIFGNTVFALAGVTSTTLTSFNKNSKEDNVFKVAGNSQSFTVIGEENGKYFVVANEDYGTRQFSTTKNQVFNPQEKGNIAYWLNNEFISEDYTGKKLPQQILDYIDYNHIWETEPSGNGIDGEVVCGVALLSQTEFITNINILGIKDNMNTDGKIEDEYNFWWTRSPDYKNPSDVMCIGFYGNLWSESPASKYLIRPVLYLDKAFFENVKLDTSYMGKTVKNILNNLDISNVGYSYSDMEIIKGNSNDIVYVDIDEEWSDSFYDKNYVIDKKISFKVNFNNTSERTRKVSVYWQIGENNSQIEEVAIDALSERSIKIVLPINQDGRYEIKLFVSFDSKTYREYYYDLNYIKSIKTKSIDKGYNTSLFNAAESNDVLELLNATGVKTVRTIGYWNEIETSKGKYTWTNIDTHIKKAKALGIDTLYILGLQNKIYRTVDETGKTVMMGSDEEIQAFVNYAKEVAKRYPEITKYEVWNEPNANSFWPTEPNIDNYKKLVRAVSTALKEINPNIEIIIGTTSNSTINQPQADGGYWCINWKEYIVSLMEEDFLDYFDGVSIHTYYTNRTRADKKTDIKDVVDIVRQGGGFKKIYMSETGGSSGPESYNKTEDEKAREMVRQFVIGDEYQLDGTWVYEFVNSGTDIANAEHNYGVVSSEKADFRPFEAYYANKYYLSQIDNAVYLGKTSLNENITAHLYARAGEAFLIAWSNSEDFHTYTFPYEVTQYDLYGKLVAEDCTSLSIDGSPVYIYGISNEDVNNIAKEFISTHIKALSTDYGYESFLDNAESMMIVSNAEEAYNVMSEISVSASNLINSGSLTSVKARALLFDINRIYNRLSNYLATIPNAKEANIDDVQKAYEHYKITLDELNLSEDKGTSNIYQYGLFELKNLSYDNITKLGNSYSIDKNGELTITGSAEPGTIVNMKITNSEGTIVCVDSQTADVSGIFCFNYLIDEGSGEYTVYIGTSQSNESFSVNYESGKEYISFLQKKYYGKILKNEKLMLLSKDYLFKYSEFEAGKNLLIDVAWNVSEKDAKATFTIKNTSDKINGQVFIVGYDEQGRLLTLAKAPCDIDRIDKSEFIFGLEFEEKPAKIQAFLWTQDTIQPLMKVREFKKIKQI